jgi:hypothetical protein
VGTEHAPKHIGAHYDQSHESARRSKKANQLSSFLCHDNLTKSILASMHDHESFSLSESVHVNSLYTESFEHAKYDIAEYMHLVPALLLLLSKYNLGIRHHIKVNNTTHGTPRTVFENRSCKHRAKHTPH